MMKGQTFVAALCFATTMTAFAADPPQKKAPAPLSDAAQRMTVPAGFNVTLFAGEPDVRQPIAFTFDDRGRLWVAECYSYPAWLTPGEPKRDRVLIFEDTDGDGKFDKRKIFYDQAQNLTGIELGFGGVWLCSTPNLLFVPDKDGDDVPDGKPEIVLDGWSTKAQHNMFNSLIWAPDGWLWGCNGITATSYVGKPGTPDKDRVAMNCGVWRYHPTRKIFETVANGTTNPWGLDFDEYGEAFITNCVIPHVYHVVHGAHFERMFGQDFNPYLYQLMPTIADHLHWAGGNWTDSRGGKGKHGEAGGGHAHVGAMVYLGDNWPDSYRNSLYTFNLHGNRINHDTLERQGSTYVAKHLPDFLMGNDEWFRGIALKYGPDGSVFMIDWSDTDECHDTDVNGPERETGRIHRVAYGTPKPWSGDLAKLSDAELVKLQFHKNEWFVRHARRILQERASSGKDMTEVRRDLLTSLESKDPADRVPSPLPQLRALWALNAVGRLEFGDLLVPVFSTKNPIVRAWVVRLIAHEAPVDDQRFVFLALAAREEQSPVVRRELASAASRIPVEERVDYARSLASHSAVEDDLPLSLMLWYAVEPSVSPGDSAAELLVEAIKNSLVRRSAARRLTQAADESKDRRMGFEGLIAALSTKANDPAFTLDIIAGIREALRGRKSMKEPILWPETYAKLIASPVVEVREQAMLLALIYNDSRAVGDLRNLVFDRKAEVARRVRAMEALVDHREPGFAPDLRKLMDEDTLRGPAIRSLAAFDDSDSTKFLLDRYKSFSTEEKADAVATLASRKSSAAALLSAIASGAIPRRDVSIPTARQILAFKDSVLADKLESAWGSIKPTSQAKVAAMARYKGILSQENMKDAEASRGRAVFAKNCASCHKLFDAGGDVGPELTGSNRSNIDYLLENVLDPSAVVGNDFKLTNVATKDGRLIAGIVREQNGRTLTIRTANETITLPKDDIEEIRGSNVSMMPEGLFDAMSERDVRDLAAYMAVKAQVPSSVGK